MVWKEEPKKILVGKPSAPTTLRQKDTFGMKGKFFISSWLSLDYHTERKHHVSGTKVLPQFWKVSNIKMNKKLPYLHVW